MADEPEPNYCPDSLTGITTDTYTEHPLIGTSEVIARHQRDPKDADLVQARELCKRGLHGTGI